MKVLRQTLRRREPAALAAWDKHARLPILREKFIQFLFFTQWQELRQTCREQGVRLLADVPIYVTMDSADVWSHPDLMPTAEDLDDPLRMVEAGRQEPAADEMDLALAQLLEQAEQERRDESDEGR